MTVRAGAFPPIIPVVVIDDAAVAPAVAEALHRGGISCAEITLRTPAGLAAIAAIAGADLAGFRVGAGTVLTEEQVDHAADAGAQFIVSPGLDPAVVERARERGLHPLPGAVTATEIQQALRLGIDTVKFFPADRMGGLDTIRALSGPFPDVGFVPSGGVHSGNLAEYLEHPSVRAVSGSWMVSRQLLADGEMTTVERLAAAATAAASSVTEASR